MPAIFPGYGKPGLSGSAKGSMPMPKAEIIYNDTVPAVFICRINRFTAEVEIDGKRDMVHVKNTGRLGELLLPGASVTLQKAKGSSLGSDRGSGCESDHGSSNDSDRNPKTSRKTAYDLISVYKPGLEWVNIDSLAPNALMKQYLQNSGFYDIVQAEHTYGDSRFDFYMKRGSQRFLTEVKGCTLAWDLERGIGLFPDAPTERGVKHLKELAKASREGYLCTIAFVIQMNGIHLVFPNDQTQPEFRAALEEAVAAGVNVTCLSCQVDRDKIKIVGCIDDTDRYVRR